MKERKGPDVEVRAEEVRKEARRALRMGNARKAKRLQREIRELRES